MTFKNYSFIQNNNLIVQILQYLLLKRVFSPLVIRQKFNLKQPQMTELQANLETRKIIPYGKNNARVQRIVNLVDCYKALRSECQLREIEEDKDIEAIYKESWNETITAINIEVARQNRHYNVTTNTTESSDNENFIRKPKPKRKVSKAKKKNKAVSFLDSTFTLGGSTKSDSCTTTSVMDKVDSQFFSTGC